MRLASFNMFIVHLDFLFCKLGSVFVYFLIFFLRSLWLLLLIYNYLCDEYGKDKVEAKSEAFVQLGIITAGQAMSGEYDMSYKVGDETIYVEVKAGEGNRIYLSPSELAFAKDHADCYQVYYVTGLNTDKPEFSILSDKFWEDERYALREIIETIEVTF